MVHIVEGVAFEEKAVLKAEIEATVTSKLKIWMLSQILVTLTAMFLGFGTMTYYMGRLAERFDTSMRLLQQQEESSQKRGLWMERKDALDDDMIQFLREQGYQPPAWYIGKDADVTGK